MNNIKFDIKFHFWPATPDLREIKFKIDNEEIYSVFLSQNAIRNLAMQLRSIHDELMTVANSMDNEDLIK